MQLKQLFDDDAAVSPVIGVILMVAITVILAAVIGTFVLGLGDQIGDNPPSASYDWDQPNGDVSLTHVSGQNLDASTLSATVNGTEVGPDGEEVDTFGGAWAGTDDGTVSAGDSVTFASTSTAAGDVNATDEGPFTDETEFRVIWTASGGDSSSTLTTYTYN